MGIATQEMKFGDIIDDILKAFPQYGELLAKEFDDEVGFIRKSETSEVIDKQEGERVIIGRISTDAIDRDNDVVLPQGGDFVDYAKNNVVLWSHDYGGGMFGNTTYELPHAKAIWVKQYPSRNPSEVRAAVKYHPKDISEFGNRVYEYRLAGNPLGYSIGFIPQQTVYGDDEDWEKILINWKRRRAAHTGEEIETIKEPGRIFARWKLLEFSDVKIPANPDAVQLMISKGLLDEKERDKYTLKTDDSYLPIEKPYPNEHACRLRDPADFQDGHWSRGTRSHEGKKYSVIFGRLKGETTTTEQAYRYKKDVWTVAEARSHCKSHNGISFEPASEENSIDTTVATKEDIDGLKSEIAEMQKQISLLEEVIYHEDEQDSIDLESIESNQISFDITIQDDKIFNIQDIPAPDVVRDLKRGRII